MPIYETNTPFNLYHFVQISNVRLPSVSCLIWPFGKLLHAVPFVWEMESIRGKCNHLLSCALSINHVISVLCIWKQMKYQLLCFQASINQTTKTKQPPFPPRTTTNSTIFVLFERAGRPWSILVWCESAGQASAPVMMKTKSSIHHPSYLIRTKLDAREMSLPLFLDTKCKTIESSRHDLVWAQKI